MGQEASATQSWLDKRGSAALDVTSDGVARITMRIYVSGEIGAQVAAALEAVLQQHKAAHVFWDLELMIAYDTSVRIDCTRALRNHWPHVGGIYALVRTRIVAMGVAVANLALENRMKVFTERAPFEAEYDRATGRKRTA